MITLFPKIDIFAHEDSLSVALQAMIETLPNLRYSIFQLEEGDKTDSLHAQVYIEFSESYRFTKVVKLFTFEGFKPPHVESRKHSRTACRNYCKKQSTRMKGTAPIEIGQWRPEGKSNKSGALEDLTEMIIEGLDEIEIVGQRPDLFLRYGRKISETINLVRLYNKRCEKRKSLLAEAKDNEEEE